MIRYTQLNDYSFCDEIRLMTTEGPLLCAITIPRYKTSGLSGDEWRISAAWQMVDNNGWFDFDTSYRNIQTACQALYGGLYSSHPGLHDAQITTTDFYLKGTKVYEGSYDGKPLPLLHTAGHLPWAYIIASENWVIPKDLDDFCFQPGCDERAISTYKLKFEYCRRGHKTEIKFSDLHRRFCLKHLRRGDCGLEDADDNYIVVDGPGPDEAQGWEQDGSPSVFGGTIYV